MKYEPNARDFLMALHGQLTDVLIASIKDKRSAVMREGCFTVAMFVQMFGNDVLAFALDALDLLVPYSQSSIRVISSGATIASTYICKVCFKNWNVFIRFLEYQVTKSFYKFVGAFQKH